MKISVAGDALVIQSELTVEQIELLKQRKPEALKLADEKENAYFAVSYSKKAAPSPSVYGVVFDSVAKDGSGKAILTTSICDVEAKDKDALKEIVADLVEPFASNLEKVEAQAKPIAESIQKEIADAKAKVKSNLTIC